MIKQIIYGKRQSGKSTYVCHQMFGEEESLYVCYNMHNVEAKQKQYPILKGRFVSVDTFKKWLKEGMHNKYDKYKKFYFQWLDWIYFPANFRIMLIDKDQIVIFDQQTTIMDRTEGVKFVHIERNKQEER